MPSTKVIIKGIRLSYMPGSNCIYYFLTLILFSISADAKFQLMSHNDQPQLLDCQLKFIKSAETKSSTLLMDPVGKFIVGNRISKPYDRLFFAKNRLSAHAMMMVPMLAGEFISTVCSKRYSDGDETNAVYHGALSWVSVHYMGYENACRWTTGHEMYGDINEEKTNFKLSILTIEKKKQAFKKNDKMDLHNNAQGLRLAQEHKQLTFDCLQVLRLKYRARKRGGSPNKKLHHFTLSALSRKQQSLFDHYMKNNQKIKHSCQKLRKIIYSDKYTLKKLHDKQCNDDRVINADEGLKKVKPFSVE